MRRMMGVGTLATKITLAESGAVPTEVQVLRVGKFKHPSYGNFEITPDMLAEMVRNFDERVRGIDIAFDYFHESDREASGWPKQLELRENGTELWATGVEWTPNAAKKLADRELRYFSADFTLKWKDPESGKVYNNVLMGGGLTNRPFVKEMDAIVASEGNEMTIEELKAKVEELEAANKKLAEEKVALETEKAEQAKKLSEAPAADAVAKLETENTELKAKLETAEKAANEAAEAKKLAEKETEFAKLLSEGKACAAQKEAFVKNDMAEFIKLAQPVNLEGKGSTGTNAKDEDEQDKVLRLAEEKVKSKEFASLGDAISAVRRELNIKN